MKNKRFRFGSISLGMLVAFGAIHPVQANIVADSSAAAGLRPDVTQTDYGTPQVNIQAPSAAGVSRNVYSEFNVDERGAVLNNSRSDTFSDIGGFITGNVSLANGAASIILNEVNSRNPSQLNGIIEVAGQRAEVVIANPSGISCNGCGFINASRGVLTTGQALVENGVLTGYQVEDGAVTVEGRGLYGMQEYTDIIARSVKINSYLQAQGLNITTGRNRVDAENTTVTGLDDSNTVKPELALDVTSLGSIFAGKIRMIGTEKGVGVNLGGTIDSYDGVEITADGDIYNSNALQSSRDIRLSGQSVHNSNDIYSNGDIYIDSNTLNNAGGRISATQGKVTINSQSVDNQQGEIWSNDISVNAGVINNQSGRLEGRNIAVVQATSLNNKDGLVYAGSALELKIEDGVDPQGTIYAAGEIIQSNTNNEQEVDTGNDAPEENVIPETPDQPAAPEENTEEPEGEIRELDEGRLIGYTEDGIPVRDVTSVNGVHNTWSFHSALNQLLNSSRVTTSEVWQNDDVMNYLYLSYLSGTEMTPQLLEAITNRVFGLHPKSEHAKNIAQVKLIAELVETCVAGNCQAPDGPVEPEITVPEEPEKQVTPPTQDSFIEINDDGIPLRNLTGYEEFFQRWKKSSGFEAALSELFESSDAVTAEQWENKDMIMTYLYLNYADGMEMTPKLLEAVTDSVFGLYPASERAGNMEQVRLVSDLIGRCVAGSCKS